MMCLSDPKPDTVEAQGVYAASLAREILDSARIVIRNRRDQTWCIYYRTLSTVITSDDTCLLLRPLEIFKEGPN